MKYEDCTIEQSMYLVYLKYGPDKTYSMGRRFGDQSVYYRDYYTGDVSIRYMDDKQYHNFLI